MACCAVACVGLGWGGVLSTRDAPTYSRRCSGGEDIFVHGNCLLDGNALHVGSRVCFRMDHDRRPYSPILSHLHTLPPASPCPHPAPPHLTPFHPASPHHRHHPPRWYGRRSDDRAGCGKRRGVVEAGLEEAGRGEVGRGGPGRAGQRRSPVCHTLALPRVPHPHSRHCVSG